MLRTHLVALLVVASLCGCSQVASTQSPSAATAERLATHKVVWDVCQRLRVTYPYASPAPSELPIEFLVAWSVYHSDMELFRVRVTEAKLLLETLSGLAGDTEYLDAAYRNAAAWEGQVQPTFEKLEASRSSQLNQAVAANVWKEAAQLVPIAQTLKNTLKTEFERRVASQPDVVKSVLAAQQASVALRSSRAAMSRIVADAKKAR